MINIINYKYFYIITFILILFFINISCSGNNINLDSSELIQLKNIQGERLFRYNDSNCKGYYCASISLDWEEKISDEELLKFGEWLYNKSNTKLNKNNEVSGKKYRIKIYHPPDFQECTWWNSNECRQYLIAFYYRDLDVHNQGIVKIYTDINNLKEYYQPISNYNIEN